MTASVPDEALAGVFEEQRGRLVAVAYRMLGSRADAEDAVQEAWLRLARQDEASIDNLAGWLTTVVGRVCIDVLRSRKTRPEMSYDDQMPEFVVTEDDGAAPEDEAVLANSVGLAMLVVLDALNPAERLAIVLHDMFAVPFDEIGQILGKSADASKMLASRARGKVRKGRQPDSARQQQREVVDAFLAAARAGDFERLMRLLAPDVTWTVHTPRGVVVKLGATEVVGKIRQAVHAKGTVRRVLVNGEPGIAAWSQDGEPFAVMACTVVDGRIVAIESMTDAARLAAMDLPVPPD
jgi:RNA polymerase sigma-70 factor (ECF subfamily)